MPNITCPECDLRVSPRNGACPSCGTQIGTEVGTSPLLPHQQELFSAKAIHRTRMWPASLLIFLGTISLFGMITPFFTKGETLTSMSTLLWILLLTSLLGAISYLWYIRTTVIIRRNESGEANLYLKEVGGKVRKMELPLKTRHSWSTHPHPVLILGNLIRLKTPVLTLCIEDSNGKILCAFQEEVKKIYPIPQDWPEEERTLPKEVTFDCFPLPRFNLPLLKNTLDQVLPKEDLS